MDLEQRVTELEKQVAGLREAAQPEKVYNVAIKGEINPANLKEKLQQSGLRVP